MFNVPKYLVAFYMSLATQTASTQTVEPGRCYNEMAGVIAAIDAVMSREKADISGYSKRLQQKLPKGPCDIEAIRAVATSSPRFRWYKIGKMSDMFRFSNEELVSDFWIDLNTKEIPRDSLWIRVKKTEYDYE
ncbi:hypothetical protein NMA58_09035 [Rhizobium sp. YTUHZ045]|uniref:hypothetical protein n=1 Tax=Rhizobium sp. YTUHZ045 TaxID=2962888 RepID=UPI003DA989D4